MDVEIETLANAIDETNQSMHEGQGVFFERVSESLQYFFRSLIAAALSLVALILSLGIACLTLVLGPLLCCLKLGEITYLHCKSVSLNRKIDKQLKRHDPNLLVEYCLNKSDNYWASEQNICEKTIWKKLSRIVDSQQFFSGYIMHHLTKVKTKSNPTVSFSVVHFFYKEKKDYIYQLQRWELAKCTLPDLVLGRWRSALTSYRDTVKKYQVEFESIAIRVEVLKKIFLISGYPLDPTCIYDCGEACLKHGFALEATQYFADVPTNSENYQNAMLRCGLILMGEGKYDLAKNFFQKAYELRGAEIASILMLDNKATLTAFNLKQQPKNNIETQKRQDSQSLSQAILKHQSIFSQKNVKSLDESEDEEYFPEI